MNLWSKFLSWGKKNTVSGPIDILKELLRLDNTRSGVPVNWRTALQATTWVACVRVISEGIAQCPFKLHKRRADGSGSDVADSHSLFEITNLKPNDWQSWAELAEQIVLHLCFMGNAYIYIVRGPRDTILELLPYPPHLVRVIKAGWDRVYKIEVGGGAPLTVASKDMWHIRGLSWDGTVGLEGVKLAREAIALSVSSERHSAQMFANGARPGGILTTEANLEEDQASALKARWEETQGTTEAAYTTAILSGGLKWMPVAQTSVDGQHLEQRAFQVEETCRAARVMPIMVGHASKAMTFASSEQMFLAHVVYTLSPWFVRIEQSANINLLTVAERAAGYYFKFNANALLRGAHADRSNYFAKALGAGGSPAWMTQDEVRALDELNPMGGAAALLPIPTNVAPTATPLGDNNVTA